MFDHIIGVSMKREERFTNVKEFSMGKDKFKTFSLLLAEELLQNRNSILFKKNWMQISSDLYKLITPHDHMVTLAFKDDFDSKRYGYHYDGDERPVPNYYARITNITFEPVDRTKFNQSSMVNNPTDRGIKDFKEDEYDVYRVGFLRWDGTIYKDLYTENKYVLGHKHSQDYIFQYVWIPHEVVLDPQSHLNEFHNIANWLHIKLMDRTVSEEFKHRLPFNRMRRQDIPEYEDDGEE